jgi:hypothetical protein
VLCSARREALVVLAVWLAAMAYTVGYCYSFGYGRDPETLAFVFGFPDWIFLGIIAPWAVCVAFSWWFAFVFMADADLGEELPDDLEAFTGDEAAHG